MNKALSVFLILFITGCACTTHRDDMRGMMNPANLPSEASGPMRSINFPFDSAALSNESQSIIKSNVAWLKENGNPKVQLGGNCDERGTNEYNMVLGMSRAQATLKYLTALGEDRNEFTTVSFGEELALDPEHNEAAWAKNRRVDFDLK